MFLKIYRLTGKLSPYDKYESTFHVLHEGNINDVQRDISGKWNVEYVSFVKGVK